ncbi:hypothetical protein [Tsukamurella pseudospumae]|uniref:Uncharacterized protein n=1 Tax=Tsukamurella pseudospumae TaxID=239498 RepID=A0A138ANV0_9ACTN|nr:hypothetical protein [Tsukamurella pseudospumae]KXP12118.1 hypothetical protein AXK60_23945 [Tsukamurella pseudospumae]
MGISSFGASVGPGPVHCVLLDLEDGRIVGRQARTIDPGPYRLGRRGNLLSSGFDLLASHSERTVDASAVTVESRRDLMSVRCGARGGVRSAGIVRESDAVLRALDERGLIARYPSVMIANLGAGGLRIYTVSDGAVTAERRARGVVVDGPDAGVGAAHGVAEFLHATIGRAAAAPEAVVLVGSGAQNAGVREAVADIARAAGAEPLSVEEPEAIAATGAALLAADRRAAGTAPSSLVSSGLGGLGGHSVRLTAAVLPLLVLAALTGAVLATGYATGIIGPAGQTTDQVVPTSTEVRSSAETAPSSEVGPLPTSSAASTLPPVDTLVPTSVPRDTGRNEVTPTMTTFAPPPVHPTTTRAPWPTPTPTVPSTPTRTLPTTILPSIPTGTPSGTPVPTEPSVTPPAEGSGQNPPPGSAVPPSREILPGNGLVGPGAGAGGGAAHPDGAASSDASPDAARRVPGATASQTAPAASSSSSEAPTVTTPAP